MFDDRERHACVCRDNSGGRHHQAEADCVEYPVHGRHPRIGRFSRLNDFAVTPTDLIIHANGLRIGDNCHAFRSTKEICAMSTAKREPMLDYTVSAEMVQGLIDCAVRCGVPRARLARTIQQPPGSKTASTPPARYSAEHIFAFWERVVELSGDPRSEERRVGKECRSRRPEY